MYICSIVCGVSIKYTIDFIYEIFPYCVGIYQII